MATFDQLPPEQRAILELIVQRERSYDSLSEVLQLPVSRVRELARLALTDLAPVTAGNVDPEWRSQVADYMLGQQTGPEATATRGHLKHSEFARSWALSLLDSLDTLYAARARPEVPLGDGARAWTSAHGPGTLEGETAAPPAAEPTVPAATDAGTAAAETPTATPVAAAAAPAAELSPEARSALRRRRILGTLAGLLALAAIAVGVLALTGTFSSSKKKRPAAPAAKVLGSIALRPVGPQPQATGVAVIAQRSGQLQLVVQAKLNPAQTGFAYEVWLYNSPTDVVSLGAQEPDPQGNFAGAGPLPANYTRYRFVDISYEQVSHGTGHTGPSVLRGSFASVQSSGGARTTP